MKIDKKLDELILLLNDHPDIKKMSTLKEKISDNEINLINEYRNNPTVTNKKKLYDNEIINEYLTCETSINYLIIAINNKLKRRHNCESNKW